MPFAVSTVLISDAVDPSCVDLLKAHNIDVTCKYKLSKEEFIREIPNYDGLIVRSDTKVTSDVLAAAKGLKVVGRAGTGVDNIDLESATRKGVLVLNTPGGNSISACELTCALISALARHVAQSCEALKAGRWDRKLYSGSELFGKTLAVLGLGRIGREVAFRMQAFGMKIIGFDPMVTKEEAHTFNVEKMELKEIWPLADYITVHTPLIPQTRNLLNASVFSQCKRGVRVINVARGGIIDEVALLEALNDGRCGGAALDVFTEEPPCSPSTLAVLQHPKVVCTPHLGASTKEAQSRVAVEIAEQFVALSDPKSPYKVSGAVNAPVLSAACVPGNSPWMELTTNLGRLLGRFRSTKDRSEATVELTRKGPTLEKMSFLEAPALMGLLTGSTKHCPNLINTPMLAKEANLSVTQRYELSTDNSVSLSLKCTSGSFSVSGTVRNEAGPFLLSVNGVFFSNIGVPVSDWRCLYLIRGASLSKDYLTIAEALNNQGVSMSSFTSSCSPQSEYYYLVTVTSSPHVKLEVPTLTVY